MKKFLVLALVFVLLAPAAVADLPDLSGLSYDELVMLKDRINLAIWESEEWQEVTVPAGVWVIGVDIPAGHWTIRPVPGGYVSIAYCDRLDAYGKHPGSGWHGWNGIISGRKDAAASGDRTEIDLVMEEGMYFVNNSQAVIFTPYTGKPNLGFK